MFRRDWRAPFAALALVLLSAVPVAGQDQGRVGLTMGYPSGIGVMVGLSERVALRPEISLAKTFIEGPGSGGSYLRVTDWELSVGLSAFVYLHRRENLRLFASPRLSCTRSGYTWHDIPEASEASWNLWQVSGTFGFQHALSRQFSVFGDLGIAYTHEGSARSRIIKRWGPRAGFGVILFF